METGRLKIANGLPAAETFRRELQAFQRAISAAGHDAYGGHGEHDDLVVAVALAAN